MSYRYYKNILSKQWCDENKLTINVKKTKLVVFSVKHEMRTSFPVIKINDTALEIVQQYRYLGMMLDLNMYNHIDNMYRMASDKLFILRFIRPYSTQFAAITQITIVKTMILPYLDIGNCLLTGVKLKEIDRLETVLNTSLPVAYNVKNPVDVSRYKLHCSSKVLPLNYRR